MEKNLSGNFYAAFSGGKDSLAVLSLLKDIGCFCPVMTQADDLDWSGKKSYCLEVVSLLGFGDYEYLESPVSALSQLAEGRERIRGVFSRVVNEYVSRRGMEGVILGLRKEESLARKMNRVTRGLCYVAGGIRRWTPVADWSGLDIMALHVLKGNPLFFIYTVDYPIPPHERRMSWPVVPELLRKGQGQFVKKCDVNLWNRLVRAAPWLSAETC